MSERRAQAARRSRRARSQHILRTKAFAAALVDDAGIGPEHLVLELGAGSGELTAELARAARRVVAVELDPRWAARLRRRWPNAFVVEGDAASIALPHEPFRVVANLPFDRTTTILRHLLDDPHVPLVRADLVVEWGVAVKRALPWPSTLNGVLWSTWYTARVARRLPRDAFVPAPSVDAGVLVLERRVRPLVPERGGRELPTLRGDRLPPRSPFRGPEPDGCEASASRPRRRATSTRVSGRPSFSRRALRLAPNLLRRAAARRPGDRSRPRSRRRARS